jgi:predicted nucleic acid-binding Zn ribbon protein
LRAENPAGKDPAGKDPAARARLAAEALAEAKADARARGDAPAGHHRQQVADQAAGPAGTRQPGTGRPAADRPGRRPRREDPQPLTGAIDALIEGRGWHQQAAMGSVFGRWAEIVGRDLAAHTRPDSFADGELAVTADSTAWATQVRLLAPMLVRRLNDELGDGSVRRVRVRGPAAPRPRGGWRVPGSKGPGDTYG